ncbi:PIN domain-containing protein [Patescibacteria group bacterium]|nr:PIN domain-containing protein [Patescibacteria group bacterium]MBU1200021.1 PIN domain-containing protein [Patescibacteria group bacterium]MBU1256709.1 PIN domain-containing protein [Patescibacteria group bacterium]MBU1457432.1 PIN domain-containing protein [Patescibacteria group bacterium]
MKTKTFCLDTNYLVRFLTRDIESQAQIAKKIILNHKTFIPAIVFAETVYILNNHYQVKKNKIFSTFLSLFKQPNITHPPFIPQAMNIYNQENISFYDSLILAESLEKKLPLKTFDQKLQKTFSKYS